MIVFAGLCSCHQTGRHERGAPFHLSGAPVSQETISDYFVAGRFARKADNLL